MESTKKKGNQGDGWGLGNSSYHGQGWAFQEVVSELTLESEKLETRGKGHSRQKDIKGGISQGGIRIQINTQEIPSHLTNQCLTSWFTYQR